MSSNIQNKLLQYEYDPSSKVWNEIAAALDNASTPFVQKLHQFEEEPLSSTWEKIYASLNKPEKEEIKVVPFFKKYRRPLKYTGAIAIFCFLALLTSLLISKKSESEVSGQNIGIKKLLVKNDSVFTTKNSNEEKDSAENPSTSKYMIYTDAGGKSIRLSKKMFGLFACEQNDISCKERIRKLQEWMTNLNFSSDFTGVLEILNSLKENQ